MHHSSHSTNVLALATLIPSTLAALYSAPIQIADGKVQGFQALNRTTASDLADWKDVTAWLGVPFAASTAGDNRWKAPQPAVPWKTTLEAFSYGPGCPQSMSTDISEDCLTVNIWSPATSANEKLPVAVWSYGAGTTSSNSMYDGSGIASQGVVFVTYNYRTGPFGWLALPELSEQNSRNISGNYGLLDQIEVLKWTKKNIAAFGGDPDHITTVGQSFGSGAVYHTINSPLAKGLIVGAVAESGIKDPYDPEMSGFGSDYVTLDTLYSFSKIYAESLNATTVAQLRALSTAELLTGTGVQTFSAGFDPVLDGYVIPSTYLESLEKAPINDVPVLVGNNRDEDGITYDANYTVSEYLQAIDQRYNTTWAAKFLELYPANTTAEATVAYKAQLRDEARVSTWSWATRWAKHAKSPVFTYMWNHAPPGQDQGAYHASEIPYVLNTLYADQNSKWLAADYNIASVVSAYWVNFIKNGNPNTGNAYKKGKLANWPKSGTNHTTFNIGDSFQEIYLASATQVEGILEWFLNATTTPY